MLKHLPVDELSAITEVSESGHSKDSSSEGEEKGQQRRQYQERGGWRVVWGTEQREDGVVGHRSSVL